MNVTLFSFGYKHDQPDADAVIDVRFLPNPYYVPELSPGTGLNGNVAGYVLDNRTAEIFFHHLKPFLLSYLQEFADSDREVFRLAVGCTGGRHRSVAVVEKLKSILSKHGVTVDAFHRDIDKL